MESIGDRACSEQSLLVPDQDDSHRQDPLARGVVLRIVAWFPTHDDPSIEEAHFLIRIRCPLCGDTHRHGWVSGDDWNVTTHRCRHCNQEVAGQGYMISVFGPDTPEYHRHAHPPEVRLTRPRQRRGRR